MRRFGKLFIDIFKFWFGVGDKATSKLKITLALSLAIHLGLSLSMLIKFVKNDYKKEKKLVEVSLTSDFSKKIAQVKSKRQQSNIKMPKFKRQIVNNELKGRSEKPIEDRFLGEKNQVYDRQTIAKRIEKFNKASKGSELGNSNSKKSLNSESSQKFSLKDLSVSKSLNSEQFLSMKKRKSKRGSLMKLGIKNGDDGGVGLSSNNDFIEDLPLGDFTHLNTQEFKYYGFYHRIRQQLEQFWGNSLRSKATNLYKSGRRMPANSNLITSLRIKIDSKGNIVRIMVRGSSGIREFDDAAIESFNKAGPFPNPPKGMLSGEGFAEIEWGFVVKS